MPARSTSPTNTKMMISGALDFLLGCSATRHLLRFYYHPS